jgi:hypothetical protein
VYRLSGPYPSHLTRLLSAGRNLGERLYLNVLNVLNANANCPLPPEVRVESVARTTELVRGKWQWSRSWSRSRQPSAFRPHVVGHPVIYLSLSGEEHRGLSSNLTFFLFLSTWDFHSLVGCVPFLVVHSQARFSMMHACMHGNGPPSESPVIQPTLKLSEIVELACTRS